MQSYLFTSLVVFVAGAVQGLSGFGFILLALPLLCFFLSIKTVVPLVTLFDASMTAFLLLQLRKHFQWKKIYPLFIGSIPGIPLGVLFLKHMDKDLIQQVLGVVLVSYSLFNLLYKRSARGLKPGWAYLFGFLAGYLRGALGAAGPAVIVYTSLQSWNKDLIKVTLQGYFFVSSLATALLHAAGGLSTPKVWRLYVVSLALLLAGTYVGSLFYGRIKEESYRKIMFVLLALLGVFMIARSM